MPSRLVDGNALWRSKKLRNVDLCFRAEYANLLPLAEANGAFEYDPEVVWADVYAFNRPDVGPETVARILQAFQDADMLSTYEEGGKTWGVFEGIHKPGRLPSPTHQARYTRLPPPPPVQAAAPVAPVHIPDAAPAYASRSTLPIETQIESLCRDSVGQPEERKLWTRDLRAAVKAHGHDTVLDLFDVWTQSQVNFTGRRPVSTFLRALPHLSRETPSAAPSVALTSPGLQQVEDAIALLTDNEVVFSNTQKPLLAVMVREHGPARVQAAFRTFWERLDDYTRRFAPRDWIEKGPQMLRTLKLQEEQRARQEEFAAQQRAQLQAEGAAELARLDAAEAAEASLADELSFEEEA